MAGGIPASLIQLFFFAAKGTTGGLEVVMRSIIYAAYSKDLSVKTTTAKIQMMKQGKYVGGYAPYGQLLLCW